MTDCKENLIEDWSCMSERGYWVERPKSAVVTMTAGMPLMTLSHELREVRQKSGNSAFLTPRFLIWSTSLLEQANRNVARCNGVSQPGQRSFKVSPLASSWCVGGTTSRSLIDTLHGQVFSQQRCVGWKKQESMLVHKFLQVEVLRRFREKLCG